jgi:flagellar protein FliS
MAAFAQVNAYLANHYDGMTPEQLILLLYKGALDRIELTRQAIKENDIQKRGENLGKVIAIVSELNASLNPEMEDEGTRFLRGLYAAILAELPKVSVTNDITILERTASYLGKLKEIWQTDVMGMSTEKSAKAAPKKSPAQKPAASPYGAGAAGGGNRFSSISV